ncbi:putative F-box/FBD/LRR-repeat protein [Cardamine amara subsp. amara]|uniref:F-box/FBD/LRR-repeat protein n=1 Tax=Cardamine amara subsp. amara TaxID=228776 RepID=A0ABD0ZMH3_CARAN
MLPKLAFLETNTTDLVIGGLLGRLLDRFIGKSDKQRRFIDDSLQVHKENVLETFHIELGPRCPIDVNVGKWIENAVDRKVRELCFKLTWSAEPTSLPKSLYTCDTLVSLSFSNKILVDVPFSACFPSLKRLGLYFVVYKDENSLVRLLSSCPILKYLMVDRHHQDNVNIFSIRVPSLENLSYDYVKWGAQDNGIMGTLVIDSPVLKKIFIIDYFGNSCSFESKPRLDKATINFFYYPNDKFMRSLSTIMVLEIVLTAATFAWFNAINFSQLIECKIIILNELDWLEPLMGLLQNSPNLKVLFIDQTFKQVENELPLSWNQPSSVPGCLSSHLEIFEWKKYGGRREEKEMVKYIFANSKCLKRAGISLKSTFNYLMMKDLESMSRVSTSSQLLFSTQLEYVSLKKEMMMSESE